MGLIHLLLKDTRTMTCQHMRDLSQEMDDLIATNVVAMQNSNMLILVETVTFDFPKEIMTSQGWKFDDGLYEKLLIEYATNTGKILTRWK